MTRSRLLAVAGVWFAAAVACSGSDDGSTSVPSAGAGSAGASGAAAGTSSKGGTSGSSGSIQAGATSAGAAGTTGGAGGSASGSAGTTSGAGGSEGGSAGAAGATSGASGATSGASGAMSGASGATSGASGATSGASGASGTAGASGVAGAAGAGLAGSSGGIAGSAGAGASAGGTSGASGASTCGNGKLDGNEPCDGVNFGGASCASVLGKPASGTLACVGCSLDTSGCTYCGNGKRDGNELCDGADVGSAGCPGLVGPGSTGVVACTAGCGFDVSSCSGSLNGDVSGLEPGAVWPMWRGGPFHAARARVPLPGILSPAWSYTPGCAVRGHAVVSADGHVYAGCSDGKLHALSKDGVFAWSFPSGGSIEGTPAIAYDGSIVFASRDATLYAVTPAGTMKWAYAIGAPSNASITIDATGTAYLAAEDGSVHAVDAATGAQKWKKTLGVGGIYSSRTSVAVGPTGQLYVPEPTNVATKLYALDVAGNVAWTAPLGNGETSPVIGPDGRIYHFGAILQPDGTVLSTMLKWGHWGLTGPLGDQVFFSGQGSVSAQSLATFGVLWTSPSSNGGTSPPLIGTDSKLLGSGWDPSGTYLLSADGTLLNTAPAGRMFEPPAPGLDGRILVSSNTGLIAFKP